MILAEAVPSLGTFDLVLRVIGAGALGGLVGLERELSDQPAGFRTHILVSLGAALFTMLGAFGLQAFFPNDSGSVTFDPTRVAAQVVTGIGFLGAGAIIRQGATIRGLTTAAAMWVTAAIGTAVGVGFWRGAIATTVATIFALYGLKRVESKAFGPLRRGRHEFVIDALPELKFMDLAEAVERRAGRMVSVVTDVDQQGRRQLTLGVLLPRGMSPARLADLLTEIEGVAGVEWVR